MSDHKHGEMDISVQEATFEGFVNFTTKFVVFVAILTVLMAIFLT